MPSDDHPISWRTALAGAVLSCGLLPAQAQPIGTREEVTTIRPLLIAAIQQGRAVGVLGAGVAQGMAEVFRSRKPIEVDVERTAWLKEPGCARLKVTTRQAAVVAPVGKDPKSVTSDQQLVYAISYCESGTFPNEPLAMASDR
ncbi:hypothetical protein KAK07_23950 [Ideonella sp. 4Y16]|uniref:hypothetical protein n=1 Tax=Ideonella alba TaxID=2824118 RepID=UPI001B38ABC6|nr:hypothetical protein [Ideonella alba]MBQ0946411.1 hypothetical protein [Ideonella alba]